MTLNSAGRAVKAPQLLADEAERLNQTSAVGRVVEPAARPRRVRQGNRDGAAELVARADALGQAGPSEQTPHGQAADEQDETRPEQPQLPVEPEGAEVPLDWCRRAVAPPGWVPARVAAGDRGAVEGLVERLLVELEPAAERAPGTAAPRASLQALDDTGRLTDDQRDLTRAPLERRRRLQRVAGLGAGAAGPVVPLQGG